MSETQWIKSWSDIGIYARPNVSQAKVLCPSCSETRKNKRDKCLSINFSQGVGNCKNCGVVYAIEREDANRKAYVMPSFEKLPLSENTLSFFKSRGIEERTLEYFKVSEANEWMPERSQELNGKQVRRKEGVTPCICFDYYFRGLHTNTKFRASLKGFKMVKDAILTFYGIDKVKNSSEVCIQEGEIDTMTAYQCNVFNSISVPNGASSGNQRLEYLDNCIDLFANKTKIVIATDADAAGRSLRDELIRRFGAERCWTIDYPEGCKDTNEVLLKHGSEAVKGMYDNAKQVPLDGIFSAEDIRDRVKDLYDNGFPETLKAGYPNFDQLLSFKGGELTMVTGIPGHGKTTFLDQILVRLAARYGWRCGIFSPENDISVHTHKLISKLFGEPTLGYKKITEAKLEKGIAFVNDHFYFVKYDEIEADIDGILLKCKELVMRHGINCFVIDPYNCIEHKIPYGQTETMYISELLTKITSFAKINGIHIFLVAHPVKIDKDKNGNWEVPTLYKIAGSANFYNKTYNGFTVYMNFDTGIVDVHVQKVKFDYVGQKGLASFHYDKATGRYTETPGFWECEWDIREARLKKIAIEQSTGTQQEFNFPKQPDRDVGNLTDINKLVSPTSFDFTSRETAPF